MAPSATADTNIYISSFQFGGVPRRFLDLARAGTFRLDISDAILLELLRVLREKFQYSAETLHDVEAKIVSITQRINPTETLDVIKTDPDDNRILECAAAAGSDYIVTGDVRHILPLGNYGGIPIIKVADFLRLLSEEVSQ
jgi:putative PIN family toxin of toxin-antitoxin system